MLLNSKFIQLRFPLGSSIWTSKLQSVALEHPSASRRRAKKSPTQTTTRRRRNVKCQSLKPDPYHVLPSSRVIIMRPQSCLSLGSLPLNPSACLEGSCQNHPSIFTIPIQWLSKRTVYCVWPPAHLQCDSATKESADEYTPIFLYDTNWKLRRGSPVCRHFSSILPAVYRLQRILPHFSLYSTIQWTRTHSAYLLLSRCEIRSEIRFSSFALRPRLKIDRKEWSCNSRCGTYSIVAIISNWLRSDSSSSSIRELFTKSQVQLSFHSFEYSRTLKK